MSARETVPASFVDLARRLTEVSRPILKRYYRQKLDIIDNWGAWFPEPVTTPK